jgi:hypothetical protein
MKRSAMISHKAIWILLAPVALAAQSPAPAQSPMQAQRSFGVVTQSTQNSGSGSGHSSLTIVTLPPQTAACPVALRAQHLADGSMVRTSRDAHPKGVGQWLHLTVANPQAKQVTNALITVHGFADVPRMTEAAPAAEARADAQRTMTASFSTAPVSGAAGQADGADVWVPGMTAVTSIELKRVIYADGSQWSFAGGGSCRITPDPLMLVAGR